MTAWGAVERMIRDWLGLPGVQIYFRDRGDWSTTSVLDYVRRAVRAERS